MFEQITIERGHCTLCNGWGLAISLPLGGHPHLDGPLLCESCIRSAVKAADVLKTLRQAKATPPKRTRKGRKSSGKAPTGHPPKEAVSSLVPGPD